MATPCATPIGVDVPFGIPDEEDSLLTQNISMTHRMDKKEIRNGCGNVASVIRYNKTAEVSMELVGLTSLGVGDAVTLANATALAADKTGGSASVDEITIALSNEDAAKSTIKITQYAGIDEESA